MFLYNPKENIYGNTIEIHYWLNDKSHLMKASVLNRCEYELLGIIKEVSKILAIDIEIETEAIAEGGLRKWLKVIAKDENKNAHITTAVIVALVTSLLITPLGKLSEKLIDKAFEDVELKDLEKERLKYEIIKLKQETENKIENNNLIKKKISNYYESLDKYPKVEKISYNVSNDNKSVVTKDKFIEKKDFKRFVIVSDDLEPIEIDDALIEIISPVLKKGKYKWSGYYKDEPISFHMKSKEFKTLIQNGKIEFKNGFTINSHLIIRKRINNEGVERVIGYDVLRVNKFFQNEKPIETNEGKKHRQKKEFEERQMKFF